MKKLVTVLLTLALLLTLTATAFANEVQPQTFTLTITGAKGHTYDIYQIFTGDVSQEGDKTVLSNVKYGLNHYPVDGAPGTDVSAEELKSLTESTDPVKILDSSVKDTPYKNDVTVEGEETSIVITNVPAGYYMIVDVSAELTGGETKSPIMLQVLETVTIASKHASIVSEKKVADTNDSYAADAEPVWVDSADYDLNDAVPFQLSVTIPSTLNAYETYELTFHDKQAAGFGAPNVTAVYILQKDGNIIPVDPATADASGYTLYDDCTRKDSCEFGGCTFNVHVGDLKEIYGGTAFIDGDKLIVEYTAQLKAEGTNVGILGNENGMYVCHPDGHTPKDFVTVFTYELTVKKVDGTTKEELAGAGFTLYKWDFVENDWLAVGEEMIGDDMTVFTWSGIDDGKYRLVETTTPSGYNTVAPYEFEVTAQHKTDWSAGGNSAFMDLISKDAQGGIVFADAEGTPAVEDGKLGGTIENYKGSVLPETGAEGTLLFIGIGSLLVVVAAVFLITRKKMSVYED